MTHGDSPPAVQVGWTDSATPKKAYPQDDDTNVPLRTWQDDSGKSHTSRVYATYDLSAYEGKKIYSANVFLQKRSVADCSKRAVEIWRTKPVTSTPTWNRPAAPLAKLGEILTPVQFCPGATITFDVGAAVQDAVAHRQRYITFEIRVPEQHESDASYSRGLHPYRGVQLSTQFNSMPQIDSAHLYNGGLPCTQLKPYPRIGGFARTLQAVGTDLDEYDQGSVTTEVAIWPKANPDARHVYSPWSKKCFFTHDRTAPTVTSFNYPADTTGEWGPAGVPGSSPSPATATRTSPASSTPVASWAPTPARPAATTASGSATTLSTCRDRCERTPRAGRRP
ncbi:hypothetical protein ABZ356_04395 [Micromonospora zamorensis]|uniref:hypothetical protein n=1 Tax=Micromonospora zamorensis TaxID=709883 RepID=UPI00340E1CFE